jgi:hypothetical protein
MAFAAPQFGALMQVPSADHDTDMLSDAPEEGHDFDIDVDAMSDAEDRDVDFVLDGGNAPAAETGTETVDQEMLEPATDPKTADAPMGESGHVPDEVMDAVVVNAGQEGDLQVPHEPFGNQNSPVVEDAHTGLLAPQQYSGGGISHQTHTVLDTTLSAPLASVAADAKSDDHHTLPTTTDPGVVKLEPSSIPSRDPQAEEKEAEHPPTQIAAASASNDPSIPSPDQERDLVTDESKNLNQQDNGLGDDSQEQSGRLQNVTANDLQYHEEDEQAEDQNEESDALKKPPSSECAALVSYGGSQLSLFPPVNGLPEAYLLDDASLAERALRELFIAFRLALGPSIGDDSQLQMEIPGLRLIVEEVCKSENFICMLTISGLHRVFYYHAASNC